MASRDAAFYVQNEQNVLQIPDLKTAMEALKLLKIDARGKGIKNKDNAIALIMKELGNGQKVCEAQGPSRGFQKALEDDEDNRKKLLQKCDRLYQFYRELPSRFKKDLNQIFPGIEQEFEVRVKEIKKRECTILVAGETAAGKSSLINLILGVDILPTSQLGCTSTICEIRSNRENIKEAVGYFRSTYDDSNKRNKRPPMVFNLQTDDGIQRFKAAVMESDEDGESPFNRIEVMWPIPMLQEGIVIVDTPGIGGGGNMTKYAERYLSQSYGFIYVINSANAGGIQKGRLQNFMRLVINSAGEDGFNSESTLFVCNRWEMIPDQDRDAVKKDTLEKLSRYYKDVRKNQIHFMSVYESMKAATYRTATPEYNTLMTLIERLLPDSLRSRLNTHYRWMSTILKRSIYTLKVAKVMTAKSRERVKDEFAQVKKQIERLEQNSQERIGYLRSQISQESERVVHDVIEALRSESMAKKLFSWHPADLPRDNKKKIVGDAFEIITAKIAVDVNMWAEERKIVSDIKRKIISVCKRDFELMEEQIAKLEGILVDGDTKVVQDLHKSMKKPAPVKSLWKKANTGGSVDEEASSIKGLGGVIATVVSPKHVEKQLKKIFDKYTPREQERALSKMQDATKAVLDAIFQSKNLQEKIHAYFKRFVKGIDAVAKMIPDFLKADQQMIEMLREEMMTADESLKQLFPKLITDSHILQGQLDLFFVNYIMVFDYDMQTDVICCPDDAPIGSGSFADVYIGEICGSRQNKPVALKVCKDALKENTVTDILLEDRTLRELDHENIVKYYGAGFKFRDKKRQKDMQWVMLLEICKSTLKEAFIDDKANNPYMFQTGSSRQDAAMREMAYYCRQLCNGLDYLHRKGFVHRDIKLENILVTEDKKVKLTDVGLAKPKVEIAFSIVGSPVYMAPEVLLATQNYDSKADIYGLAIVFWEMWYGRDAADYIQQQLFGPLEQAVRDGLRPSTTLPTKPPESWLNMIEQSWEFKPERRPSADVHFAFFDTFLRTPQSKSTPQTKR